MTGPDVPGAGPLAGGVLKREVQKGVELLCRAVVPVAVGGRVEGVAQGLLGLKKVLVHPAPVGGVEAAGRETGGEEGEGAEGELRAVEEPLGQAVVVQGGFEDEAPGRDLLFGGGGGPLALLELLEEPLGAVLGYLLWVDGDGDGDGDGESAGVVCGN